MIHDVCDFTGRKRSDNDIIDVAVVAKLHNVSAAICSTDRLLADMQISGCLCLPLLLA